MTQRLQGRTALVTGATSGIGRAIALAMAAEGAHVIVSGRDTRRGDEVVAAIRATGGKADFVAADLGGGSAAISELTAKAIAAAGGPLDILVNNAAFLVGRKETIATTEALIDQALSVSVKAPFLLTAALVPQMVERGSGVIVNIGSINGLVGMAGAALYGSTKAALHSLTKSWAAEFGPAGVRVNTVAPGPTLTEGVEGARARREAIRETIIATTPSRTFSTPADVAAAVVFLASDDAANIHGATLSVDGGFTAV
jgi:NAD(P)-dependent dehydrogenase (short-subunit alcohol dehydrogenase family)